MFYFRDQSIGQMLAQANNVSFFYNGALLSGHNLPNSDAAVHEMYVCQQAFTPAPRDPFVESRADPFHNP